jgi:hypothetical protein
MSSETPPNGSPAAPSASGVDFLYRIFCVKDEMPPLEKLLARLTSGNPYNPGGSFIFPPGAGMRRLQDALGASADYFVMGYQRAESPVLFEELEEAIAADQAKAFEDQDRMIARDAKLCVVLRAQIKSPENNDFVETLVHLADAFREILIGIVHDVRMEKVWGHKEWQERVMEEPFSVLNHVTVRSLPKKEGEMALRLRTYGLRKFGSGDLIVEHVAPDMKDDVRGLLMDIAEHLAQGELLGADETIDYGVGKIRLVGVPPIEPEEPELLALADEDESKPDAAPDPKLGIPILIAAMRTEREKAEGKRAGGGKGAD